MQEQAQPLAQFSQIADPHKQDRKFQCSWQGCGKTFLRKTDVTRHYRIHLNDRPFKCVWPGCGKAFMQRSAVKIHYRYHRSNVERTQERNQIFVLLKVVTRLLMTYHDLIRLPLWQDIDERIIMIHLFLALIDHVKNDLLLGNC
jgi:hypothetical protein